LHDSGQVHFTHGGTVGDLVQERDVKAVGRHQVQRRVDNGVLTGASIVDQRALIEIVSS